MGCTQSVLSSEDRLNKQIDTLQTKELRRQEAIVKLLLLGAGESGKSTLFKQMKLLYGKPWTEEELREMIPVVHTNIMSNFLSLLNAADLEEHSDIQFEHEGVRKEFIKEYVEDTPITPEIAEKIKQLWSDAAAKQLWEKKSTFQVLDSLEYYLEPENFERITDPDYVPVNMDILQARVRTSGIVEEHYVIDGVQFSVFDVGGQRNERKKWIHAFEGVTAVIFVAAINEYDQVLYEDNKTDRHEEALKLFDEICNSEWFIKTSMILFMNKSDLFREKLKRVPFKIPGVRFTDYDGPEYNEGMSDQEFEEVVRATTKYLTEQYLSKNRGNKKIYSHVTCATDTENSKIVFQYAKDIILSANLSSSGFLLES